MADNEWLMVIDMQRAFAEPGPWQVPGFAAVAARIEHLIPAYGERLILTRYVPPERLHGAWRAYFDRFPTMLRPADDPAWDVIIAAPAGARQVTGTGFGKWDDDIAGVIGPNGTIALSGVTTDCCVLATALAAADAGRAVRVIADACAGATALLHEQAIAVMATFAPMVRIALAAEVMAPPR